MPANKAILISVLAYVAIFVLAWVYYSNMRFTGDAAGKGLESGLTLLGGLAILFFIALALTIYNAFSFSRITEGWIKIIFFVPLLLPLLVFGHEVLEIGKSGPPPEPDPLWLTMEVRVSEKLERLSIRYRGFGYGYTSQMRYAGEKEGLYYYEIRQGINRDTDRMFQIIGNDFETPKVPLDIPETPVAAAMTDWQVLPDDKNSIITAFRFMVEEEE